MPRYTYQGGLILVCTLIWEGSKFNLVFYFLERGEGREEERERNISVKHRCVVASHAPPTWDLAHNPAKYSDWESNQRSPRFASKHSVH